MAEGGGREDKQCVFHSILPVRDVSGGRIVL